MCASTTSDADDELRGSFYLDLYARRHKRAAPGWMSAWVAATVRTAPAKAGGHLTCNFNGPVDGKPALFTPQRSGHPVPRFGHGIHHMLTRIDVAGVAGINGVAWDAVELPSQFLENCAEIRGAGLHLRPLRDRGAAARRSAGR